MKKLFFSIICGFVLMLGFSAFNPALAQDDDGDSERNPLVEDFGSEWKFVWDAINGNPPETRSIIEPALRLKLMVNANTMELYFNKNLGEVSVVLANETGTVVCSGVCNAAPGTMSSFYIPSVNGEYTLRITGKDYQGEAFYIIRR